MGQFAAYESFSPQAYLHSYYSTIGNEADGLLAFLVRQFDHIADGVTVLEFGGGPTLIGVIPAARRAARIHFCDYVEANREAVARWRAGDESEFDWHPYLQRCLELEHGDVSETSIAARAARIRAALGPITTCDIYATPPVADGGPFDVILSNYCLDAVTGAKPHREPEKPAQTRGHIYFCLAVEG